MLPVFRLYRCGILRNLLFRLGGGHRGQEHVRRAFILRDTTILLVQSQRRGSDGGWVNVRRYHRAPGEEIHRVGASK